MSFGKLIQRIEQAGLELKVQGFFNVESGGFGIGNGYYPDCDCVLEIFGESECFNCVRWDSAHVAFPSGDGDGIYLAAAIVNPKHPDVTLGVITVFDYKYQMAAYGRQRIENEEVPDFPIDLAMQFKNARALEIGSINVENTLLIGDKGFSIDSSFAVVDFPNPEIGEYTCLVYCEEVDQSLAATLKRLEKTQGLDAARAEQAIAASAATFEAMRESLGIAEGSKSQPSFITRAAVALSEEISDLIEDDEFEVEDWALLKAQFFYGSVVTSHRKQMTESVIWQNAMLAREWDRAAGEIDNDTAKILLFDLWTWLYQGRELGNQDCVDYLKNFKYQPTVEEQIHLLTRRGMLGAAAKLL
jgi:hypothetical protein